MSALATAIALALFLQGAGDEPTEPETLVLDESTYGSLVPS